MNRPKEAAAELWQLEQDVGKLQMAIDKQGPDGYLLEHQAFLIKKIEEIRAQYPTA